MDNFFWIKFTTLIHLARNSEVWMSVRTRTRLVAIWFICLSDWVHIIFNSIVSLLSHFATPMIIFLFKLFCTKRSKFPLTGNKGDCNFDAWKTFCAVWNVQKNNLIDYLQIHVFPFIKLGVIICQSENRVLNLLPS